MKDTLILNWLWESEDISFLELFDNNNAKFPSSDILISLKQNLVDLLH